MDIQALSNMNEFLKQNLESLKQKQNSLNSINKTEQKIQNKTGTVLVKKGDAGYIEAMDLDGDGQVTMEEFDEYCEQNGVSGKEKIKLMSLMQAAKVAANATENAAKTQEENLKKQSESENADTVSTEIEENDTSIYAKKGDDKYNADMDENSNGVVTHQEYLKYCNRKSNEAEKTNANASKEAQVYSQNEHYNDEAEIEVEAEV